MTQTRPHVFGAYLVAPTGRNIGRYEHLGQITGVDQCDVVPEDQVPDEIQALAMSHLLLKGLNNGPA